MKPANIGLLIIGLLILALIVALGWSMTHTASPTVEIETSTPAATSTGVAYSMTPTALVIPTATTFTPVLLVPSDINATSTPTAGATVTLSPLCADVVGILKNVLLGGGLKFASPGGVTRSVSLQGVTTGETSTEGNVDLAQMYYLENGHLQSLNFSTGFVDDSGKYSPMNVPDPHGNQSWNTQAEASAIFRQKGKGVLLTLTGFVRGKQEIAWEDCSQYAPFNPQGICDLGLDLELASYGGGAQFIQTGIPPAGWFAFGWAVYLNGLDITLSQNAGGCVP